VAAWRRHELSRVHAASDPPIGVERPEEQLLDAERVPPRQVGLVQRPPSVARTRRTRREPVQVALPHTSLSGSSPSTHLPACACAQDSTCDHARRGPRYGHGSSEGAELEHAAAPTPTLDPGQASKEVSWVASTHASSAE